MHTYKNLNGKPIVRSCFNCRHFKPLADGERTGYCLQSPLMFAYNMKKNVFRLVRTFYLCETHEFPNEKALKESAERVELQSILKEK